MREDSAASDTSVGHEAALPYSGETVAARDFARIIDNKLEFHRLTLSFEIVAACSLRCPGCWWRSPAKCGQRAPKKLCLPYFSMRPCASGESSAHPNLLYSAGNRPYIRIYRR